MDTPIPQQLTETFRIRDNGRSPDDKDLTNYLEGRGFTVQQPSLGSRCAVLKPGVKPYIANIYLGKRAIIEIKIPTPEDPENYRDAISELRTALNISD